MLKSVVEKQAASSNVLATRLHRVEGKFPIICDEEETEDLQTPKPSPLPGRSTRSMDDTSCC
jgi:hypothetical protein